MEEKRTEEELAITDAVLDTGYFPVASVKSIEKRSSYEKRGFRYACYKFIKRLFDIVSAGLLFLILCIPIGFCLFIKWIEDAVHPKYELTIEEVKDVSVKPAKRVKRIERKDGLVFDCKLTAVKLEKGEKRFTNPIYSSDRVGKNEKIFKMYKIRSMIPNADRMKQQLIDAGLNEADPPAFKMQNDPRITKFGRFLRKSSFDELLQLLNIINGTMSVVGPRSPLPNEVSQYTEEQKHRLDVKGGLLCLWQIQHDRNKLSFDEWVKLDLEYIEKQSVWFDLKIIFKGAWMVVFDHSGE